MSKSKPKTKPSFTAFLIPKILPALATNNRYSSLLTRQQVEISRRFARECARNDFAIGLANKIPKRPAVWLVDNLGIKGLPVHYAARKKYIRNKLDAVIGEVKQVVMVGAGFDTLCLEYHEQHPQIKFFELDQNATQKIKLDALKKMPQQKADKNLHFIACDLSQESLGQVLRSNNFDNNAKAFFVIEGVLPYLEKADVEKLFAEITKIAAPGSYVVFGSMAELKVKNDKRAKFSDAALAARKEKYKFAAKPQIIAEMLKVAGFDLLETKLYHELQQSISSESRLNILKHERGEHYYFARKN